MTKAQQTALEKEVKRLMDAGMTEAEARETALYDMDIDAGKATEFDLTPEQQKIAKKYTNTGTKKRPAEYQFTKRERKPNEGKRELIEIFRQALENAQIAPTVSNIERQIDFVYNNEQFSITLTQHRQKKQ